MKRYLFFVFCFLLISHVAALGQRPASEVKQMVEQINQTAATIHTLSCDFTQTKVIRLLKEPIVSKGHFAYTDREQLRWEYKQPYPYCLIINGQHIRIVSDSQNQTIDMERSSVAKRIAQLIMKGAKGKFLDDQQNFAVEMYVEGNVWKAVLTPKQNKMKRLFVKADIVFDTKQQMMTGMTLYEKSGDKTVITLSNIRKNIALDASLF